MPSPAVDRAPLGADAKPPAEEGVRRFPAYVVIVLFPALFWMLTAPVFDSEFWWHLASGRWIWEHGALPRADPFDCTSAIFGAAGQSAYQLTQYWLAQVALYAAYLLAGLGGVIVLRAAVYTALFGLLFLSLRRAGSGPLLSSLLLALGVQAIVRELALVADRPQMWSSLFFVALLPLLHQLGRGKRWAQFALPPFMLLWSNLHGGYILGVIVLAIGVGAAYAWRYEERRRMLVVAGISVAMTGCNPSGFEALYSYPLLRLTGSGAFLDGILEEVPLFRYVRIQDLPGSMPALTALLVLPLLTLWPSLRSWPREQRHLLPIYLLTLGLGIRAQRYLIFLIPMSCLVISLNASALGARLPQSWGRRFPRMLSPVARGAAAAAVILSLAGSYALAASRGPTLGAAATFRHEAEGAADYLKRSGLRGNVFNEYGTGGYLAWRLHPEMKIFIYGRMAYPGLLALYNDVVNKPAKTVSLTASGGLSYFYQQVFDEHAIDAVVIPAGDSRSADVVPLAVKLAWDDAWTLVAARPAALVFLRTSSAPAALIERALPKRAVFDNLIAVARAVSRTAHGRVSPVWRRSLAVAQYCLGNKEEALRIFDDYVRLSLRDNNAPRVRESLIRELQIIDKPPP